MQNRYQISGYTITTDPGFQNEDFGISSELERQLEPLYLEANDKRNKHIIDKLTNLVIKYPCCPQLKNYLSVAYNLRGNYTKALEVNRWILAEHPDYLFGKLNEANRLINNGEAEKVADVLGGNMELKSLYPDREVFHLAEVTGFYKTAIRYFVVTEKYDLAENRLELLEKIAPDHSDTKEAERFLFTYRMSKGLERYEAESKMRISPQIPGKILPTQIEEPPVFNHFAITALYNEGIKITPEKLEELLALPRASLIEDLETVLADAEKRYDFFGDEDWKDETHSFALHAIFLLTELRANESLPKIISLLENDDEFLEFWLGDHITTTLWQCFYGLGLNQTEVLKHLLLKPGVDTCIKSSVSEALCQMALQHPVKSNEILQVYETVFSTFNEAKLKDNLVDSDFLGLAIGDAMSCNLHELLPVIKQLYEKGYVSLSICGDYSDVEKEFNIPLKRDKKREVYSIVELYHHIITTWWGYRNENKDSQYDEDEDLQYELFDDDDLQPGEPVRRTEPKTGRNEPCPCGSGKKYKKCCLNN